MNGVKRQREICYYKKMRVKILMFFFFAFSIFVETDFVVVIDIQSINVCIFTSVSITSHPLTHDDTKKNWNKSFYFKYRISNSKFLSFWIQLLWIFMRHRVQKSRLAQFPAIFKIYKICTMVFDWQHFTGKSDLFVFSFIICASCSASYFEFVLKLVLLVRLWKKYVLIDSLTIK